MITTGSTKNGARTVTSARQAEIEKSIVTKVQDAIDARGVLRLNHRLVNAVENGDAPELVHELKAMMPDRMTAGFNRRFVSPLSTRSHNPLASAARWAFDKVEDDFEELMNVMNA